MALTELGENSLLRRIVRQSDIIKDHNCFLYQLSQTLRQTIEYVTGEKGKPHSKSKFDNMVKKIKIIDTAVSNQIRKQ